MGLIFLWRQLCSQCLASVVYIMLYDAHNIIFASIMYLMNAVFLYAMWYLSTLQKVNHGKWASYNWMYRSPTCKAKCFAMKCLWEMFLYMIEIVLHAIHMCKHPAVPNRPNTHPLTTCHLDVYTKAWILPCKTFL